MANVTYPPYPARLRNSAQGQVRTVDAAVISSVIPIVSKRDTTIDVLRGWFIVMMVTAHIGAVTYTNHVTHVAKYFSGACGFVFLSGLVLGMVSRRRIERDGLRSASIRLWKRAGLLWLVHVTMIVTVVLVNEYVRPIPGVANVIASEGLGRAALSIATFRFQSGVLDILPMYVIYLAVTPLVLMGLRRRRTALCVFATAALYIWAQFDPNLFRIVAPSYGQESFRVAAWQLLFIGALILGYHRREAAETIWNPNRRLFLLSAIGIFASVFAYSQIVRISAALPILTAHQIDVVSHYFERPSLQPARLTYFCTAALLAYTLVQWMQGRNLLAAPRDWLATMGRKSLYCFIVHVILYFVFVVAGGPAWARWTQELATLATLVAIYFMAKHHVLGRVIPS